MTIGGQCDETPHNESISTDHPESQQKAYISLAIGISLTVFLCSTAVQGAYGMIRENQQKIIDWVGHIDALILNCSNVSDETEISS